MILKAFMKEVMRQAEPRLAKGRAETAVKMQVYDLDIGIDAILSNAARKEYTPDGRDTLLDSLALELIFPNIPEDVVSIILPDGTQLNREKAALNAVEEKARRTWSLEEVDQLATSYADSIQQPRTSLVPKKS